MKRILLSALLVCSLSLVQAVPGAGRLSREVLEECLEAAAKKSSRSLNAGMKRELSGRLAKTAARQGNDVLRLVKEGGLEMLEQGARHGDDFWRFTRQVPEAARSMALHGDELMPLVRRLGKDVLILESRNPGLAFRAVSEFGEDSLKLLAKIPPEELPRLLGYSAKAVNPSVKKMLIEHYGRSKTPSRFLNALDWKKIMAGGLTASMIIGAYKISDGVEEGIKITAEKHPETFQNIVSDLLEPAKVTWYLLALLILLPLAGWSLKHCRKNFHGKSGKDDGTAGQDSL